MSERKRISNNRKREYRLLKSKKQQSLLAIQGQKLSDLLRLAFQVQMQAIQLSVMSSARPGDFLPGGVVMPVNDENEKLILVDKIYKFGKAFESANKGLKIIIDGKPLSKQMLDKSTKDE